MIQVICLHVHIREEIGDPSEKSGTREDADILLGSFCFLNELFVIFEKITIAQRRGPVFCTDPRMRGQYLDHCKKTGPRMSLPLSPHL